MRNLWTKIKPFLLIVKKSVGFIFGIIVTGVAFIGFLILKNTIMNKKKITIIKNNKTITDKLKNRKDKNEKIINDTDNYINSIKNKR